jgi:hypothetical protein
MLVAPACYLIVLSIRLCCFVVVVVLWLFLALVCGAVKKFVGSSDGFFLLPSTDWLGARARRSTILYDEQRGKLEKRGSCDNVKVPRLLHTSFVHMGLMQNSN